MPDTQAAHTLKAEEHRMEIYKKMSPTLKWLEAWKLREAAWALKLAGMKLAHPDWDEERLKKAVKRLFLHATT